MGHVSLNWKEFLVEFTLFLQFRYGNIIAIGLK